MTQIAVIDAGIGNLRSVENAFERIGCAARTVTSAREIIGADAIVLPGVGAFEAAMNALNARGLIEPIKAKAAHGTPLLGLCLGMQLYADVSEEFGEHAGLELVSGRVVRLTPKEPGFRVPNIGWHAVSPANNSPLFGKNIEYFYHVHSYHFRCANPAHIAATIEYGGETIVVAVQRGNIFGVQFHPEKSQDAGLDLIARFCTLARQKAA